MPTVTSFTADRLAALEASTVVDGHISESGFLILVQHDGTEIDAGSILDAVPSASTDLKGLVELATSAETLAGSDSSLAVTPAGLASIPGDKVQVLTSNSIAESGAPALYPYGVSLMGLLTGSGWTPNSGVGTLITVKAVDDRVNQSFYTNGGGSRPVGYWVRTYHPSLGSGGWTTWAMVDTTNNLVSSSFAQSTALSSYPEGKSRLYYTSSSNSWDFSGKAGEVVTERRGDDFARQTWTKHQGGTGGDTEVWIRTANAANGWSRWKVLAEDKIDVPWTNMSYASGFTSGTAMPLQYRVKNGIVYWRGGATGTFPEATYVAVTNIGSVPAAYRPFQNLRSGAVGTGMRPCGWELNTDGAVRFGWQALASSPSWIAFSCSYPLDT